ncbi:MAG: leucyl aminopeptidase [Halobacteriovoraceae bacterium]|jgi:leucyl aminopeptidase|nr:leucyl aminopeptidase [Halobacteriovoraceae bacterium]MBT5092723.1 leucyl aminopeptidase [Halobacteriovoraceae bacterium]
MDIILNLNAKSYSSDEVLVVAAYSKAGKQKKDPAQLVNSHWSSDLKEAFSAINAAATFTGTAGTKFLFPLASGEMVLAWGLGEKSKLSSESLRKESAKIYSLVSSGHAEAALQLDGFTLKGNLEKTVGIISEAVGMTAYSYDKHKSKKSPCKFKKLFLDSSAAKSKAKKLQAVLDAKKNLTDSIAIARDFVNDPPNIQSSVYYAKEVEKDAKKLKRVKVKILGKPELKKEKMGMFLSVNAGSGFDPRLVHLTYTPAKVTKKTKHVALVGKGLVFDTGGYSLKPAAAMAGMKFDMAGSATVYAAFRAAVLNNAPVKISCFLGMTDNAVNSFATMPDSIVTARNGKTVEVLNTDAEGRLVLGDVLDYACDQKPDCIIDAATLTGAVLIALGTEVCGLMGNDKKLRDNLMKSAAATDEYMWQLPIIEEWRDDMKSNIADLKNIGGSRWGGSAKAAAFLENFVKDDISWAHLDIAGCAGDQGHLPYCPKKGASGLVVRSLEHFIQNA